MGVAASGAGIEAEPARVLWRPGKRRRDGRAKPVKAAGTGSSRTRPKAARADDGFIVLDLYDRAVQAALTCLPFKMGLDRLRISKTTADRARRRLERASEAFSLPRELAVRRRLSAPDWVRHAAILELPPATRPAPKARRAPPTDALVLEPCDPLGKRRTVAARDDRPTGFVLRPGWRASSLYCARVPGGPYVGAWASAREAAAAAPALLGSADVQIVRFVPEGRWRAAEIEPVFIPVPDGPVDPPGV